MCDLLNYDLTDKQIAKLQNSIVRGKCLQYVLPTLSVLECTLHKKKRKRSSFARNTPTALFSDITASLRENLQKGYVLDIREATNPLCVTHQLLYRNGPEDNERVKA